MPSTFQLRAAASDLAGGADFTRRLEVGDEADGSITFSVANATTEDSLGVTIAGEPGVRGTSIGAFAVEVDVQTGTASIMGSVALRRVNAAGVTQVTGAFTLEQAMTAGTKTFAPVGTTLGTWAAGDRLVVIYRFRSTATMGSALSLTIRTGTANAEVTVPWNQPIVKTGTATVAGGGAVTVSARKASSRAATVAGGGAQTASGSKRGGGVAVAGGGGAQVQSGTKQGRGAATAAGGGAILAEGVAETAPELEGTATVTGGGTATAAGRKGADEGATVAGGGALVLSYRKTQAGAVTITGGGTATATGRAGRAGAATVAGGGAAPAQGSAQRRGAANVAGGGAITAEGGAAQQESGTAEVAGGGDVILLTRAGRRGSATVAGGGTATGDGEATVVVSVAGGGSLGVTGRKGSRAGVVIPGGGELLAFTLPIPPFRADADVHARDEALAAVTGEPTPASLKEADKAYADVRGAA